MSSIGNINHSREEQLMQRIRQIVDQIHPEAIICFGSRLSSIAHWSLFCNELKEVCSEYDILILTSEGTKYNDRSHSEMIDGLNTRELKLFSVSHRWSGVTRAIKEGHQFFTTVCLKGKMIYDRTSFKTTLTLKNVNPWPQSLDSHWNHYYNMSKQFLDGAEFYKSKGNYVLSAFMLHQVVEHASIAIIHHFLGYRATTHNLNHLLGLTKCISTRLNDSFHEIPNDGKERFELLDKAYSRARYSQEYTILASDLVIIHSQVSHFLHVVKLLKGIKPTPN